MPEGGGPVIHGGCVWETGHPADWLDFSASLRPEGPPEWVTDALRSTLEDIRYYPDPDMTRARRGLAAYTGLPEDRILPTAGGTAAIDLALARLDGCVYIPEPAFGEYARRAERYSAERSQGGKPGFALGKDPERRLHACLIPWEELDALSAWESEATGQKRDYKQADRDNVLMISELLKQEEETARG